MHDAQVASRRIFGPLHRNHLARLRDKTADAEASARRWFGHGWVSQFASLGLILVLLLVSGFSLWSAQASSNAADRAVDATVLSDDYAAARTAVQTEESLERKYRLEPSAIVRIHYQAAATNLVSAMALVHRDSNAQDRATVAQVLALHGPYLVSVDQLFSAIDRHDTPAALRIDTQEVDPRFDKIEAIVAAAAAVHHNAALRALSELRSLESFTSAATPLVVIGGLLLVLLFSSVLRQVRGQLRAERELALHDSRHDPLTGLANRALLLELSDQALAESGDGRQTGLLLLDLDRFKDVNDTLGHQLGDQLLTQIGPRLAEVLRESDTVARLGGDEFVVLLPDVGSQAAAVAVAAKLRHALSRPFRIEGLDLDVEASIGAVVSDEQGTDATVLLRRADVAMYVAKKQAIGVFAYQPAADAHSLDKLTLLSELRRAIEERQLLLHYQPKVSLSTGKVCGIEALVRWQHPDKGLVPPDAFIPLAEHTGLIGPLTYYVLDAALEQIAQWARAGQRIPVAVNLSARNLVDERLADQVAELLQRHEVPADLLELEVTESALMTEPARAANMLWRLRELGIGIAIDDFGAGYTSLAQLKVLPITELKIDRSFVSTMATDCDNGHIVKSIVELGHHLGFTTVAEGVEDRQTMTALRAAGCDVAQGYHLCRPLPGDQLAKWYRDFELGRKQVHEGARAAQWLRMH